MGMCFLTNRRGYEIQHGSEKENKLWKKKKDVSVPSKQPVLSSRIIFSALWSTCPLNGCLFPIKWHSRGLQLACTPGPAGGTRWRVLTQLPSSIHPTFLLATTPTPCCWHWQIRGGNAKLRLFHWRTLHPSVPGQTALPGRGAGGASASGWVRAGISWGLQESSFRHGSCARGWINAASSLTCPSLHLTHPHSWHLFSLYPHFLSQTISVLLHMSLSFHVLLKENPISSLHIKAWRILWMTSLRRLIHTHYLLIHIHLCKSVNQYGTCGSLCA